jgi:hypothetical protein
MISGMLVFPLTRGVARDPVGELAGKVAIILGTGRTLRSRSVLRIVTDLRRERCGKSL